ncbi:MAG TPA: hypothetical protein VF988_02155, partial [Verrucomicrobiae bacterium]
FDDVLDSYHDPEYQKKVQLEVKKMEACFRDLLQFAESPNPAVWHIIGQAYNSARGTKRNREEAMPWYLRAAEAGHAPSMVNLGLCQLHPKPSLDTVGNR